MIARPLLVTVFLFFSAVASAETNCGPEPILPADVSQTIKADIDGKAQAFTKLLGDADLQGKVEKSRHEVYQKYENPDKSRLDNYFAWVSCQQIMTDPQLNAADKVRLILDVYKVLQGERHSDLSDSIVAATVRECDILTASPSDPDRPTGIAGIDLGSLESTKAVPECQSALAAAPDNPRIKFELGRAFLAAHQFVEARRLFEQDADYVPAINSNGYMYLRGLGGPPDYTEAVALFQRAADSGDMYGIMNLADMYNQGLGAPQNERTACTLYGKAATMGDASAMFSYAVCFARGKLGEPSEKDFIMG